MNVDPSEARWFKSSYSGSNADCVEAAHVGGGAVAVRDSKLADASPVLVFAPGDWDRFADAVKSGKFDLA
ncbi:DUF397 domain-containing protein [Nocardia seriolae]|uniref:DUF397 domain-containing protein n=1 Tax=Nocardia seriolae TaxID=37332 RepID=A0ABC8AW90_9NOCA|nr:DUF397 domain-containing protein [Nocardia seriolae]APA98413.1 hypothetical protein NS506_04365 [Nocardia seriolae]MTJ64120.1 DUF397 domain-containing protein [Nocardia seriolae]MTJ73627.1 DUF397 domain-containing protein [Nocardia seriolae]MTJ88100.1 DUF397 domain-containing protein [Nocardia seriolae]MTK32090.1 DUF397 domain-containing protein [Nocardia seriolae]